MDLGTEFVRIDQVSAKLQLFEEANDFGCLGADFAVSYLFSRSLITIRGKVRKKSGKCLQDSVQCRIPLHVVEGVGTCTV